RRLGLFWTRVLGNDHSNFDTCSSIEYAALLPGEGEAERALHSAVVVEQYAERLAALRAYNGTRKGSSHVAQPAFAHASSLVSLVPLWRSSHYRACRDGIAQNCAAYSGR